jgi:hypothetical protein
LTRYGVPDDDMRYSHPTGPWASGSPGDPELDALLPGVAESMLDGEAGAVPTELRPLGETLAALRAAPSAAEFRGEEAVLAAFRSMRDLAASQLDSADWTAGPAHTLPLEIPPGTADRRPRRARHAASGRTRPVRRPPARPSTGRRFGLATTAAAVLVVVMGIFAYSGHLPGPIQSAAHVVIGAPTAQHRATPRPSAHPTGVGRLSGSATPAARGTATATPSGSAAAAGPGQWCQAYFKNPWRPGSTSWDKSDFEKLGKAAGGPRWVLRYCVKYLTGSLRPGGQGSHFPNGYSGGSWASPSNGQNPGQGYGSNTGPGTSSTQSPGSGQAVASRLAVAFRPAADSGRKTTAGRCLRASRCLQAAVSSGLTANSRPGSHPGTAGAGQARSPFTSRWTCLRPPASPW